MADKEETLADIVAKNEAMKERRAIYETLRDARNEMLASDELEASLQAEALDQLQTEISLNDKLLQKQVMELAEARKLLATKKDVTKEELDYVKALELAAKAMVKNLEHQKESRDNEKSRQASMKTLESEFSSMLTRFTGISNAWETGFLGAFSKAVSEGNNLESVFLKLGKTLRKQFSLKNIIGSFVGNIIQQTTMAIASVDAAQADFVKATGTTMTSEDKKMVSAISEEQHKFGITIQGNTANLGKLRSQISGFRNLTAETQGAVLAATNQFEALGIATEDSAHFINFATKAMGMSESAAVDMGKQIIGLSQHVSASGAELMKQMQSMEADLAQFGDNMGQEFANLAIMADKTGVAMEKLVGVAKKFDTFRGAASAVGRLNTMLGRNMIDMKKIVGLPFSEKIKYIAEQVEKSGQSFETMGRHRKQAFANALETDVATMMKILSGEADEGQKKLDEMGLSQEELNKLAKDATPIIKMLKAAMQKFIIALEPIINIIRSIVEWFAELSPQTREIIGYVMIFIGALMLLSKIVPIITGAFALFKGALLAAGGAAVPAGAGIAGAIKIIAKTASKAKKGVAIFFLFAVAALLLGGAIVLLAMGFERLVSIDLADFMETMGLLATSMGLLMVSGALALVGLLLFSMGLIALGVALLTVKTEDLRAMADLFMAIAKMPNPPWDEWTSGLDTFSDKVENNIDDILGPLNSLMFTLGLLDMFGSGEGIKSTIKLFTAVGSVDDSSIKGIEETRKLVTELRLAAESDTADAMADLLEGVKKAFNKKQELPPIIVKVGEYELFKLMDKKADKSINPKKNGFFNSL